MHHSKYNDVKELVMSGSPVRLQGGAGTGKTTIAMQIAKELDLSFESLSMTKQTTQAHIIGFMSISGTYIPTRFREAYENGGLFLLDEIDAADPNTLLCLNTIENGYMSFPDGIIEAHEDFRLIATSNPDDEHSVYTGRSKLDFATRDRFWDVIIERDHNLEASLTSEETVKEVELARKTLLDNHSTQQITMRDAMRYHKSKSLKVDLDRMSILIKDPILLITHQEHLKQQEDIVEVATKDLNDVNDIDELYETIVTQSEVQHSTEDSTAITSKDIALARTVYEKFKNTGVLDKEYEIREMPVTANDPYTSKVAVKLPNGKIVTLIGEPHENS